MRSCGIHVITQNHTIDESQWRAINIWIRDVFCYPYAQDQCPIMNQRSLCHPCRVLIHDRAFVSMPRLTDAGSWQDTCLARIGPQPKKHRKKLKHVSNPACKGSIKPIYCIFAFQAKMSLYEALLRGYKSWAGVSILTTTEIRYTPQSFKKNHFPLTNVFFPTQFSEQPTFIYEVALIHFVWGNLFLISK